MALTDAQTIRVTACETVAGSGKTYATIDEMITDIETVVDYITDGTIPGG